jgi:hypothetical protein
VRRALSLAVLAALGAAGPASAQDEGRAWRVGASAYLYPSDDPTFLLPIVTADRGALHLEARYNYEDLETVSGWVGWAFEFGDALQLSLVPMLGVVAGRSDGIAPGLEATLGWRAFELYSESEYVIPFDDGSEAYLYTWTQVTWSPIDAVAVGVSGQRLRYAGSGRTVDTGPMATVQLGPVGLEAYAYNPFSDDAFTVLGASIAF